MADERAGAEIVYGAEECHRHSIDLLEELGFPKGVLPLKDLVECGRGTNTRVSYATEVTAYIEKHKMKKMTGVKSKQLLMWVPIVEMSMEDEKSSKIYFKIPVGVGKSFAVTAFMTEEEKKKYVLEHSK
ncbi:unnamed protein product [Lactuca saligna]|uniref:Uncharacterized protein n=1 Tax=Lactuca saligna TaxID=75948 RepID=A0AA35ZG35_LACSI|nr:unnamed protein product [Lactuca saligna]